MVLLIFVAGLTTAWMARGYDVQQCKIEVSEAKRKHQAELSKIRRVEMEKKLEAQKTDTASPSAVTIKKATPGTNQYGNIFAPTNLEGQVESEETNPVTKKNPENQHQNIFAPTNLEGQVESEETNPVIKKNPENQYQNIFAPTNLEGQIKSENE
jgi:spermidine/putrescine transport system permease protein